jgi:hypothetical protein
MQRKIFYKGLFVKDHELVVGNHGPAQITINGDFSIHGLVHCPKYHLEISVNGNGIISLHGICKAVVLKRISGNCRFDLQDVSVNEIIIPYINKGNIVLKVSKSKIVNESFLSENIVVIRKRLSEVIA